MIAVQLPHSAGNVVFAASKVQCDVLTRRVKRYKGFVCPWLPWLIVQRLHVQNTTQEEKCKWKGCPKTFTGRTFNWTVLKIRTKNESHPREEDGDSGVRLLPCWIHSGVLQSQHVPQCILVWISNILKKIKTTKKDKLYHSSYSCSGYKRPVSPSFPKSIIIKQTKSCTYVHILQHFLLTTGFVWYLVNQGVICNIVQDCAWFVCTVLTKHNLKFNTRH